MTPSANRCAVVVPDRPVGLRGLDRLTGPSGDVSSAASDMPPAIALSFLRAVRRVKTGKEFSLACDVGNPGAVRALETICGALRQVYVCGRPGPISSEPVAIQVLQRLRQAFVDEADTLRKSLGAGELSVALRAFDLVRDEMDRDDTERFVRAFESADAVDLVVEIAHDMRSPLTAILMLTEMVRRAVDEAGGAVAARQLALVHSAAFGLNSLVNDVLALASGGARLTSGELVPFSVSGLVASVGDIVRPVAEERKLDLRVTTATPLDHRLGQPIALSRVLVNLASNALQHTETGEVAITAVGDSRAVRFEVADTGPGLPADELRALFEPFRNPSRGARARRFSRTGLGFAICRKLLRAMGSDLLVESTATSGTRVFFELALPAAAEQPLPSGAFAPARKAVG